ncbi:hypothetical protein [Psychrobacillus psychrotolerans]|uniref:hypothetical protein n=1 Tax=Psychrobacillus psychrotolerans TaxID=126156 RepID=UPI003C779745
MIYVNGNVVTDSNDHEVAVEYLKEYLSAQRLLVVNSNDEPMSQQQLSTILLSNVEEIHLIAIKTSIILRGFREELHTYILKVEQYVEDIREIEDFSTVMSSYTQVIEALIEFLSVEEFLQKQLIDQKHLNDISLKCLKRAEEGNFEYILDVMEYELLPLLHNFIKETNEVM